MSETVNNQQEEEEKKPDVKNTSLWKKHFQKRKQKTVSPTLNTRQEEEKKPNITSTSFLNNHTPKVSCSNGASQDFSRSPSSPDHSPDMEPVTPVDLSESISLKVKSQDGNEVTFKIKRGTPLKKLMNEYCNQQSMSLSSTVFLFDGRFLRREQTPHELQMEDGDEIDAMLHQTGGTQAMN